jgi:hypothetical protein
MCYSDWTRIKLEAWKSESWVHLVYANKQQKISTLQLFKKKSDAVLKYTCCISKAQHAKLSYF